MKHKLLIAALSLSILLISSNSRADDADYPTGDHAFVNAGVGYGYLFTNPVETNTLIGSTNYKAGVGGVDGNAGVGYLWSIDRFAVGFKLGYNDYHGSRYTITQPSSPTGTISYENNNINLFAIGQFYILPRFSTFIGLGGSYVFQTVNVSNFGPYEGNYNTQQFEPTGALGFGYRIINHLTISLDAQYTVGKNPNVTTSGWNPNQVVAGRTTNVGLIYTF